MAEEAASSTWKGHGFTLLLVGVFGLVCAFFFVLGFIAGRSQAPPGVNTSIDRLQEEEANAGNSEELEFSFFEAVEEDPPAPDALPEPDEAVPPAEPERVVEQAASETIEHALAADSNPDEAPARAEQPAEDGIVYQVAALRNATQAELLLTGIRELGLPAFILSPDPSASSQLHRVRVGPFGDAEAAGRARSLLESEGHDPIVVN